MPVIERYWFRAIDTYICKPRGPFQVTVAGAWLCRQFHGTFRRFKLREKLDRYGSTCTEVARPGIESCTRSLAAEEDEEDEEDEGYDSFSHSVVATVALAASCGGHPSKDHEDEVQLQHYSGT